MVQGRTFTDAESLDPESRVTVVNARLARRLWPDGSAVGRRVGIVSGGDVGVAAGRRRGCRTCCTKSPASRPSSRASTSTCRMHSARRARMAILIRGAGNPGSLVGAGAKRAPQRVRRPARLRHPHHGGSAPLHDVGAAVLRHDDGRVCRNGAAPRLPGRLCAAGVRRAPPHARDRRPPRARRRAARRRHAPGPPGGGASVRSA